MQVAAGSASFKHIPVGADNFDQLIGNNAATRREWLKTMAICIAVAGAIHILAVIALRTSSDKTSPVVFCCCRAIALATRSNSSSMFTVMRMMFCIRCVNLSLTWRRYTWNSAELNQLAHKLFAGKVLDE